MYDKFLSFKIMFYWEFFDFCFDFIFDELIQRLNLYFFIILLRFYNSTKLFLKSNLLFNSNYQLIFHHY
jgi:hypothetical protein